MLGLAACPCPEASRFHAASPRLDVDDCAGRALQPARIAAKRKVLENMGKDGRDTVTTQNVPFVENEKPQVVENIGGRDRGRTGDLIVASDAKKFIGRGAATTYVF